MILKELLDIDPGRIQRSADIKVTLVWNKMLTTKRKGFWNKLWGLIKGQPYIVTNLLKFQTENKLNGSKYTCYIELKPVDNYQKLLKTKVKVFCSCNDFKYRSAYILNKDNNLFLAPVIERHLGIALTEKPKVVNPTKLCKHLFAVISYLKTNLNRIDLTY